MADLHFSSFRTTDRYTHYLFRFPAKFHAPILRKLIDSYSREGDTLLDPFCGSGSLLVESLLQGRSSIGVDVDPVAVLVSRAKATPISPTRLEKKFAELCDAFGSIRRTDGMYDHLMRNDFAAPCIDRLRSTFDIPNIPNIHHWFRNYVTIDLARLRNAILDAQLRADERRFFLACFASIIRNSSNADPVPVSGLEYTSHMRRLDKAGRRIDPFELFERKVRREIRGMGQLWEQASEVSVRVRQGDAASLRHVVERGSIDTVITSPPYNLAVDYYRRHTLEMYWLGFVKSVEHRQSLGRKYIGKVGVLTASSRLNVKIESPYLANLLRHAESISARRARDLKHYAVSMSRALGGISEVLKPKGQAVIVVGNAKWNGRSVRATHLIEELSRKEFTVVDRFSYEVKNRYMSYSRHNGANINREHVLVLRKRGASRR